MDDVKDIAKRELKKVEDTKGTLLTTLNEEPTSFVQCLGRKVVTVKK